MKDILVPISPGELLDKITILEIKSERMEDAQKVANVRHELRLLSKVWRDSVSEDETIANLHQLLKSINEELWEIEDDIRDEERNDRFGDVVFIGNSRVVEDLKEGAIRRLEAEPRIGQQSAESVAFFLVEAREIQAMVGSHSHKICERVLNR